MNIRSGKLKIIVFVLLFPLSIWGQDLIGSFREYHEGISTSVVRYQFFSDSSFIYELKDDVGAYYGRGEFHQSNDSLRLEFNRIPAEYKKRSIISKSGKDSLSHLSLLNPLNRKRPWSYKYQIFSGNDMLRRGEADQFGRISFKLQEGEYLRLWTDGQESTLISSEEFKMDWSETDSVQEIVILDSGLKSSVVYLEDLIYVYAIRKSRHGFRLKQNGSWIEYRAKE